MAEETTTTETTTTVAKSDTHMWADYGMTWNAEEVGRNTGPNKSDWKAFPTKAQIPQVVDYDKFVTHFGKPTVLAFLNGSNSPRVKAQAVCRGLIESGIKDTDAIRNGVYNALRGIRAQAAVHTITIVKVALPNGDMWEGTDVVEYRQALVAAMVEMGVSVEIAIAKAQDREIPKA